MKAVFAQVLRETGGVASVDRLTVAFSRAERALNISATVTATDGAVVPIYRDVLVTLDPPSSQPQATPTTTGFTGGTP